MFPLIKKKTLTCFLFLHGVVDLVFTQTIHAKKCTHTVFCETFLNVSIVSIIQTTGQPSGLPALSRADCSRWRLLTQVLTVSLFQAII